jgi:cobalamin biosynthesis protein CobD/CbiB
MPLIPFTRWRLALADNWRRLHTRGTVIAGAAFTTFVGFGPTLAVAWAGMPMELRAVLPQTVQQWIAYTIFGLTFLGIRYTTIKRVPKEAVDGTN